MLLKRKIRYALLFEIQIIALLISVQSKRTSKSRHFITSGIREIVPCTQKYLREIANDKFSVRVGATVDPKNRRTSYTYEGYAGTMYIASTRNMMKAEDKLLQAGHGVHNVHQVSNAQEAPGYVYVIKGKKAT